MNVAWDTAVSRSVIGVLLCASDSAIHEANSMVVLVRRMVVANRAA